jgi:hypothetical protein
MAHSRLEGSAWVERPGSNVTHQAATDPATVSGSRMGWVFFWGGGGGRSGRSNLILDVAVRNRNFSKSADNQTMKKIVFVVLDLAQPPRIADGWCLPEHLGRSRAHGQGRFPGDPILGSAGCDRALQGSRRCHCCSKQASLAGAVILSLP